MCYRWISGDDRGESGREEGGRKLTYLRHGGVVAGVGVEAAGGGGGVAVRRAVLIALAVLGEGGFVGLGDSGGEES